MSSLKHLGKGVVSHSHSTTQTLYKGSHQLCQGQAPCSHLTVTHTVTLALKNTSSSFQHSGGSGRPLPQHKVLFQCICMFSVNCSVLIRNLTSWVLTKLILNRKSHQTLRKSTMTCEDEGPEPLKLLCVARGTKCFPAP